MQHRTLVDRPVSALGPAHRPDLCARGPRPVPSPDGDAGARDAGRHDDTLVGRLVPVQDQFSPAFGSP